MVLAVCRTVLKDSPEVEDAFQATFLVLIRRAGTIWRRDAVGGWLHRVAHRVAVQASIDRSRKNSLMGQVDDLSALAACDETPCDEDWRSPVARGGRAAAGEVSPASRAMLSRGQDACAGSI